MNRRERRKQQLARQAETRRAQQPNPTPPASPEPVHALAVPAEPATGATGPRTEEGKSISSRNAVRHGLTAKKLTGADLEALTDLRAKLDHEWEPQTETEKMLLAQMALSQWRLDRALELELAALDGEIDPATLTLALRYRTSAERTFFKSLAELQRLRQSIREDAIREIRREEEEEKAILRQLEAQIFKPYARPAPPEFVSQNAATAAPVSQQFVSQSPSVEPRA